MKNTEMNNNNFKIFSNKMRWLNIFFSVTIAVMHVESIYVSLWSDEPRPFISQIMNTSSYCAMYFFFFASAFWFFSDYDNKKYFQKLKTRIKSILVPYLFWNFAKIAFVQLTSLITDRTFKYSIKETLLNFCFAQNKIVSFMPLNGPTWYLMRIFSYFIFAPVLYLLLKNKWIGFVTLVVLSVTTRYGYYTWLGWIFVFSVGAYIALNFKQELINLFSKNILKTKYGAVLFTVLYSVFVYADLKIPHTALPFDVPLRRLLIVLAAVAFLNIGDIKKKYSEFAFVLYCSHVIWAFPLLKIVHTLFNRFSPGHQDLQKMITLPIVILVTIAANYLFKKFFPKLYKIAIGGR